MHDLCLTPCFEVESNGSPSTGGELTCILNYHVFSVSKPLRFSWF